jgi:transposase
MITQAAYDTAIKTLQEERAVMLATIEQLRFEVSQLKELIYGQKSERFISNTPANPQAPTLFNVEPVAELVELPGKQITYEKTKKESRPNHPGRNAFPEKLRREELVLNPEGLDLSQATKVGEDVTEVLAYVPGEMYVKRTIRPRYHIPSQQRMVQAPAPERSFSRSSLDESLVANIIVEKYVDHLPLYRQASRYARWGVNLSESTLGDVVTSVATLIKPLYEAFKWEVYRCGYLHADETTIKVQDSEKKGANHLGYYWAFYDHVHKAILYEYHRGRGSEGTKDLIDKFMGYVQTDGYAGYDYLAEKPGIVLVGCLAHARRKFHEALQSDRARAEAALEKFGAIYAIEKSIRENKITGEDKRSVRLEQALPLLNELKDWMVATYQEVLPKSPIGTALAYSLKRWDKLALYAETHLLDPDNNRVENSIRPIAIGRKNYLFAGNHNAAQNAAMIYSLLGTCKAHGIEPYQWLKDILVKLPNHPINRLKELLPQFCKL